MQRNNKRDDSKTQTGTRWTDFERKLMINGLCTEPYSPWKNRAEHGVNDLGNMVKRCIKQFSVPLGQHHWVAK